MGKPYTRIFSISSLMASRFPILLFDDFETLLKWDIAGPGTPVASLCATNAFNGAKSLSIKTTTPGAAIDDVAETTRTFPMTPVLLLEFNCFFNILAANKFKTIRIYTLFYNGTNRHECVIEYNVTSTKWQYTDSTGALTDIPGATVEVHENSWHRFAASFDLKNNKYRSFTIDHLKYDLSGIPLRVTADARGIVCYVGIAITSATATVPELLIDDFACTELEI